MPRHTALLANYLAGGGAGGRGGLQQKDTLCGELQGDGGALSGDGLEQATVEAVEFQLGGFVAGEGHRAAAAGGVGADGQRQFGGLSNSLDIGGDKTNPSFEAYIASAT